MRFSFIDNKFDTTPKPVSKSWEDLTRVLTGRRSIRDKKDGLAFIPATFREGGKRDDKDVEALTFLVLDVDDGTPVEALRGLWEQEGEPLAAAVWSTHSSTAAKPKWRAVFPLLQPVPASDWARVWRKLCYHLAEGRMDSSCSNESRLYYLPSCPTGAEGEAFASQHEGVLLDPAKWSDPPAGWGVKPAPERREVPEGADVSVPDVPHLVSKALARAELDGRNNTAFWLACQLRDNRYPQEQAEEALRQFTARTFQTPRDPFTEEEALKTVEHAYSSDAREPWRKSQKAGQKEADAKRAADGLIAVSGDRVQIDAVGRQDREILIDAWSVLIEANKARPTLFVDNRGEARMVTKDLSGNPYVQGVSVDCLSHVLREIADWVKFTAKGKGENKTLEVSPARFPAWIPRDMLAGQTKKQALPFLRAVVGCPVVTREGELLTAKGYNLASGLYVDAPEVSFSAKASPADAQAALGRLAALVADFPFDSEGDKANALALLLTPFLRHYVDGNVPLFVVEAPTPGTGKTLLASALLSLSTPGFTFTDGPSERERGASEEWSKHLGAILAESPSAVLLDNLRGMISSGTLEGFLTNPKTLKVRILGESKMQEIDASGVTMVATGNNALFQHDMARRSCFIRLDAGMEHPEQRAEFSIPNLLEHIKRHRTELLADVAVVLSAWIMAGRPEGKGRKGSFERWAAVLSGVLEVCGESEFLATDSERAAASDPESDSWRGFFAEWFERYCDPQPSINGNRRTRPVTAKELTEITTTRTDDRGAQYSVSSPGLAIQHEVVPERSSSKGVGKRLQAVRGRVFGGFKLCMGEERTNVKTYWLEEVQGLQGLQGLFTGSATCEDKESSEKCNTRMYGELQSNPANPANPAPRPVASAIPPKITGPGLPTESDLLDDDLADPFAPVPLALSEIDTSDLSDPFGGEEA